MIKVAANERYSLRSKALIEQDEKNHLGSQFHKVSLDFFANVLSKIKSTPRFIDRKVAYRRMILS